MSGDLESRYRRLLAVFPADYRHAYADEVLGVLMDSARPGQRYPDRGEVFSLLMLAARWRLRRGQGGSPQRWWSDPRWRDAAAVLSLVASVLLFAKDLRPLVYREVLRLAMRGTGFDSGNDLTTLAWVRLGWWTAVVGLVVLGWTHSARLLAWFAVAIEVAALVRDPSGLAGVPVDAVDSALYRGWPLLLTVATALLLSAASPGRPAIGLKWYGAVALAVAGLVGAASPAIPGYYGGFGFWNDVDLSHAWAVYIDTPNLPYRPTQIVPGSHLVMLLFVGVALATVAPPVRRRALALLAAAVTLLGTIQYGIPGGFSGTRWDPPMMLAGADQLLVAMVVAPAAVLLIGLIAILRQDRRDLVTMPNDEGEPPLPASPEF